MGYSKDKSVKTVEVTLTHPLYFAEVIPPATDDNPNPSPVRVPHKFIFKFRRLSVGKANEMERDQMLDEKMNNIDRLRALCTGISGFDDYEQGDRLLADSLEDYFNDQNADPETRAELLDFVNGAINGYFRSVVPSFHTFRSV